MPRSGPQAIRSDPGIRRDLAIVRTKIGNARVANGDLSGALESYRAALALLEEITGTAAPNPEVAERSRRRPMTTSATCC